MTIEPALIELRKKLNISDSNDNVIKYYTKYIKKESIKKTKLCDNVNTGNGTVNEFIKEEFLLPKSASKHNTSESPSSSSECLKTRTRKQSDSEISEPLPKFITNCEADSIKRDVLDALKFSYSMFEVGEDYPSSSKSVIRASLEFLMKSKDSVCPQLPSNQFYRFTDVVFLKSSELESIQSQYIELYSNLEKVGHDGTFALVKQDPRLIIYSLYIHEQINLMKLIVIHTKAQEAELTKQIEQGFILLVKYFKFHEYNDIRAVHSIWDFMNRIQHLDNYRHLIKDPTAEVLAIMQQDLVSITNLVNSLVPETLLFTLNGIFNYISILDDDNDFFERFDIFYDHPIYRPLSLVFFYMQDKFVIIKKR